MKLYITGLLLLLQTSCCSYLYAQKQGREFIDSLLPLLPVQKEDTNKVASLNALSGNYNSINPDSGIIYAQLALELAARLQWPKGEAAAYANMGSHYTSKSDYVKALEYLRRATEIAEKGDYKDETENTMIIIGNIYFFQSDYPRATEYYFKALKVAEDMGIKRYIANANENLGLVYSCQNDYAKALEYCLKALKAGEETGFKEDLALYNCNVGTIYSDDGMKDYPKALEYFFKALKISEKINNKKWIGLATGNICDVYIRQKNYAMAIVYGQVALNTSREVMDKNNLIACLSDIGEIYLAIAESSSTFSDTDARKIDSLARSYQVNVVIPADKPSLLRDAVDYIQQSLTLAKEINEPYKIQLGYGNLSKAYKLSGNYQKALAYSDSLMIIKDSVLSNDNKVKIANLATKREQDLKEKQIAINKLQTDKKQSERIYFSIGLGLMLLLVSGLIFNLRYVRKSRTIIQNEKEVSEGLLLNILPSEVAKELKEKGYSDAKHFEQATVLFTDFKDFTQLSEKLSAEELVAELDYCFKGFDGIIQKHGVEKIKTIGDSYMAVGGIPDPSKGSANDVLAAALEMRDFILHRANEREKEGRLSFEMRVGIHTGTVIAGIVGIKKFQYDIWGDTVNIASRMESSGAVSKVNISQTTYELVKDSFSCEYRGEIDAKGKGMMKMYFVA